MLRTDSWNLSHSEKQSCILYLYLLHHCPSLCWSRSGSEMHTKCIDVHLGSTGRSAGGGCFWPWSWLARGRCCGLAEGQDQSGAKDTKVRPASWGMKLWWEIGLELLCCTVQHTLIHRGCTQPHKPFSMVIWMWELFLLRGQVHLCSSVENIAANSRREELLRMICFFSIHVELFGIRQLQLLICLWFIILIQQISR